MAGRSCLNCSHRITPKVKHYWNEQICDVRNQSLDDEDVATTVCDDFKGTEFYEKFKDK